MTSPWMNGTQGESAPVPAALGALLAQRNELQQGAGAAIGKTGGDLLAGIIGAVQAARSPQAAGSTGGAAPGGAGKMDTDDANENGMSRLVTGGNSGPSMFSRMMTGFGMNAGYAQTGQGQNFKQFAALGKMADATRTMLKESTPTLPGQDEQPVMGMTDDQWAHAGTQAKISAFQAVKQANDMKQQKLGQMATMAQIGRDQAQTQDYAAQSTLRQQQAEESTGMGGVADALGAMQPNQDGNYTQAQVIQALKGAKLGPRVQGALAMKLFGGVNPNNLAPVVPQQTTINGKSYVYNPRSGNFEQQDKIPDDLTATRPKAEDVPDGYMPMQMGKGWKIVPDPTRWQTLRTPVDPNNPMSGTNERQVLLPKGGSGGGGTGGGDKPLSLQQAQQYLQQAGGDKAKARTLAAKDGYTF